MIFAKVAGVSSATVSRVINGSNLVKPVTAERVRRVIADLKFVPYGSATTLKYGRSSTYGLIIPDITNPFFPEFIRSFESILVDHNQDMLMATTDFHPSKMQQTIYRMLVRKVDGIALLAAEIETEPIEAVIHHRVPLVTMDRLLLAPGLSDVAIDYASGMNQAVQHLKQLRHRKIGYIGGSDGPTISDHRVRAFVNAMRSADLEVDPAFIRVGNYRITGGESAMTEVLALRHRPTALLTANDLTAIGALRVIRKNGLSVPKDFSIVGFDDIDLSDIVYPAHYDPLTLARTCRGVLQSAGIVGKES
ncbi:LacI family transcriptional regulator [Edaphobacter aggregans]|uniref:LacI family transcriptional regulator n=1 Tax=Edaphobacter aggregans TaxID=570835 RepID=A0A3R9WG59_9BACT|nr:LacI family DNA-binding transcriptional regulator [Edaphobacter aggregans]RSL16449.1 LacI family transcriptional regulator [Edaphobacter aggregans]